MIFHIMENTRANTRRVEEADWEQEVPPQVPNRIPPQDPPKVQHQAPH